MLGIIIAEVMDVGDGNCGSNGCWGAIIADIMYVWEWIL
jgi:hypothetical protein